MNTSMPVELQNKWGHLGFIKYKGNGEWSAECPNCRDDGHDPRSGDPDRFTMFEQGTGKGSNARGYCRQCGYFEWADQGMNKPSPAQQKAADAARRAAAAQQRDRLKQKQEWLQKQEFWLRYYWDMTKAQRQLWFDQGIGAWAIDTHKLGYAAKYRGANGGAMTIPYFHHGRIYTLQYRLLDPTDGGKYRFLKDTSPEFFFPWPEDEIQGVVMVVEGAKKGLVVWQEIASDITYQGEEITVIAAPSKTVPRRLLTQLEPTERIIWLLDPDAHVKQRVNNCIIEPVINRNCELVGPEKCRVIRTTAKIDDMFLQYGLKRKTFANMINQATAYTKTIRRKTTRRKPRSVR